MQGSLRLNAIVLMLSSFAWASSAWGAKILMIGDSHSCNERGFGGKMVTNLTQRGNQVEIFCAVSSSATSWEKGTTPRGQVCRTWSSSQPTPRLCTQGAASGQVPALASLLRQQRYDQVIVALGTNSLMSSRSERANANLATLIKTAGSSCDWIAPPHIRADQAKPRMFSRERLTTLESNLNGYYRSLQSAVGSSCAWHDSLPATQAGAPGGQTTDGVHRTNVSGAAWADAIAGQFQARPTVKAVTTTPKQPAGVQ